MTVATERKTGAQRRLVFTLLLAVFAPVTLAAPVELRSATFLLMAGLSTLGLLLRLTRGGLRPGSVWALASLATLLPSAVIYGTTPTRFLAVTLPLIALGLGLAYVLAEADYGPEPFRRAGVVIAWTAPAFAVLAVYQRAAGYWPILDQFAESKSYTSAGDPSRTAGLMGHPILFGCYAMAAAILAITLRPKRWRWMFAAALLSLLLSGSRSAWVGLLAVGAVAAGVWLAAFLPGKRRTRWVTPTRLWTVLLLAIGLVGAAVLAPEILSDVADTFAGRVSELGASTSAHARELRQALAWDQISATDTSFWFGYGPGALEAYFGQFRVSDNLAQTFDNSYLTLWYDYGVLPVMVLAAALATGILRKGHAAGRLLPLAAAVAIWFFDFYHWPLVAGVLMLAAGLRGLADEPRDNTGIGSGARRDGEAGPGRASGDAQRTDDVVVLPR